MKDLYRKAFAVVLPAMLGFAGGVCSMVFPVQFQAFCSGSL